ncbi:ABC transporter permease subunit [Aurantimonas coralicida]|uniref:ABC transporter permease subunit n=1 Tax=Aurantimonas coralicida TaxID=182270 RepID=UPI0023A0650F|nr:ABC transporter permease subunit [Aurantimonas coralicida]MDE0922893.1 ABC transporter permease subunit [Aurantimonas coralicida]
MAVEPLIPTDAPPEPARDKLRSRGARLYRSLVVGVPFVWLLVFFLAPFLIVFKISLSQIALAQPPYVPSFSLENLSTFWDNLQQFTIDNYVWLTSDPLYINSYLSSLQIAGIATAITLLIGYPLAYGIARAPGGLRPVLILLTILPFWTSFLIRVYAWIGILKTDGLLNQFLMWLGVISDPLVIMNTNIAVYIGIVYSYLPFMVLPIYASLERMDYRLIEAANDLGCPPVKAFWTITFPLSRPGVLAGIMLVFIPAVGEFVIPDLLGGSRTLMIGRTLWNEFFSNRDWPVSSAVAILLLIVLVLPIVWFQRAQAKTTGNG